MPLAGKNFKNPNSKEGARLILESAKIDTKGWKVYLF